MSLQEAIANSKKNQTEIAKLIGADQPKVSKIINGKLDEFSIERIIEYMQKLGYDIHMSTSPAPKGRPVGTVLMGKRKLVEARNNL